MKDFNSISMVGIAIIEYSSNSEATGLSPVPFALRNCGIV